MFFVVKTLKRSHCHELNCCNLYLDIFSEAMTRRRDYFVESNG